MSGKLCVATILFDASSGKDTHSFSHHYDEEYVERLYRGVKRNLRNEFRFCLFTEKPRKLGGHIEQYPLTEDPIGYGSMMEPFALDEPTIIMGLDTVIVGDITPLANYCTDLYPLDRPVLVPMDPYKPVRFCNGVQLVPFGRYDLFDAWSKYKHGDRLRNDMLFIRQAEGIASLDDAFPGQVISYKVHMLEPVKIRGIDPPVPADARIVYFHGRPKPHEVKDTWLKKHWR